MTNARLIGLPQRLNVPAHAYSALLLSLLGLWLLAPFLSMLDFEEATSAFLITVTIVAASYAMANQGKSFWLVIGLGVLFAIGTWVDASGLEFEVGVWSATTGALFYGVVAYEMLVDILSKKSRVDMHLINGAIAVYLLIGICFAYIYALIFWFDDGAFRGIAEDVDSGTEFVYFSFVTLTTLGYGDVTPVTVWGESLAIVGQIYLTVLVARLVGIHISQASTS